MSKQLFLALFAVLVASAAPSFATCHAVGPASSGNGSGSDWNDVMKLPTAPVRGDTYYLKDGSYGSYSPTTATSGTTPITVKKAQSYDYGRTSDGCPNDISAGWNVSTMGGSQAVFSGAGGALSTSGSIGYYIFDGNGQTTSAGCGVSPAVNAAASDCGIKIMASSSAAMTYGVIWINGNYDNGASRAYGWTLRYLEVVGAGSAGNSLGNSNEHTFYCRNGCNNLLFEHNYVHDSSCDFIDEPFGDTSTYNLNHFKTNYSSSNCHGQYFLGDGTPMSNYTFSNNLIQDVQGTAIWSILNGGQASNFNVYNNVIFGTSGARLYDTSNGILAVINSGSVMKGFHFYGNSSVNASPDYNGSNGVRVENSGSTITWQNNLFYSGLSQQSGSPLSYNVASGSTITLGYNSYLNYGSPGTSGTADVVVTSGAPNPFVNWTSYNFDLASQNADWNNGVTLSSPFNEDMGGNSRPGSDASWDRGAYEYGTAQAQAPNPPTGLVGNAQ